MNLICTVLLTAHLSSSSSALTVVPVSSDVIPGLGGKGAVTQLINDVYIVIKYCIKEDFLLVYMFKVLY